MMSVGALSGIRVLDLSRLLPGPYCSMMLGDLGAEVIKIEEPGRGDYIRDFPPKFKKEGVFFLAVNRNKKSITLNLRSERGKEVFFDLVKKADVVLEGFRPGVMDKLGIGYKDLEKINPRIIVCSISGYGQDGPYVNKAGHDVNYLSIAGIMGFTGTKEGKPIIPGIQIADIGGGGMLAAYCILAAIIGRERTGKGQYIDISMMDGAMAWLCMYAGKYFADGKSPRPSSELLTGQFACYNVYETKDGGYMSLGALEPQFWSAFCKAVDREDLIKVQFAPGKEARELIAEVEKIFSERTREAWGELLKDVDCCCEPVNNFDEAFSHPQVVARNMLCEMEHPTEGTIRQINFPGKFSDTPALMRSVPPTLGQHTGEILKELGMTDGEIADLAKEKII
jgi:crotonobetainyl-CoA:carnitine CoA-transferase CaiB-like acyl-CoA transferase